MWSIRTASSLSSSTSRCLLRRHTVTASYQAGSCSLATPTTQPCRAWFSSNPDVGDTNDTSFLTGTVKFYLRDKAYGFIVLDEQHSSPEQTSEVWVHRTSFASPHSADDFPTRPYLSKGERVKFRIESATDSSSNKSSDKAIDVLFENGRQVPLFRKNYHAAVVKGEMQRLGQAVFDILEQSDTDSVEDADLLAQIKAAGEATKETIADAEKKQAEYGPEVSA